MRWLSRLRRRRPGPAAAFAEFMEPRLLFSADLTGGLLLADGTAGAGMELRVLGADGEFASANALMAVAAATAPPVANPDSFTINEDRFLIRNLDDLLANDTDADSARNELSVFSVGDEVNGIVSLDGLGAVRFDPIANFHGIASFTYVITDAEGNTSDPATVTVTVLPVNDAPTGTDKTITLAEDGFYAFAAADFGFSDGVDGDNFAAVRISSVPTAGALTRNGVAVTAGMFVSVADISAGKLVFTPVANANGTAYASFTFQVQDDGGTARGGVDLDPTANTITIDVTAVNDEPVASDVTASGMEDAASIRVDLVGTDVEDGSVVTFKLQGLPANGTLYADAALTTIAVAGTSYASGGFYFVPAANFNGSTSFEYTVTDSGGLGDASFATATISVAAVNDAPAGSDKTITINEDGSYTFVASDFGFTDAVEGDNFAAVRITSVPAAGTLAHNGVAVTAGTFVSLADIAAGKLVFTPVANASGTAYASFGFQVQDDGGTAAGGVDLDPTVNTIKVNVISVNDEPVAAGVTASGSEDAASIPVTLAGTDVEDGAGVTFQLQGLPANGTLYTDAALTTLAVAGTSYASGSFFFVPAANFNGVTSFKYTVTDSGGLSDASFATATISVAAVNDAPAGSDKTITINEDGSYTFVASDFGFTDAVEGDDFAAVRISSVPTAGTLTHDGAAVMAGMSVSLADIAAGRLVFTPAVNANGVAYASFRFQVQDDGGTAAGGVDLDPTANTITIDITAVNDAPVAAGVTASGSEDAASIPVTLAGTDVEDGAGVTFQLQGLPANGTLYTDAALTTLAVAGTSYASGSFFFVPASNFNGVTSFKYTVTDSGGLSDLTVATATISVASVNDAPSVTAPATQSAAEDTPTAIAGIAVGDVDGNIATAQLSVAQGTLTVDLTAGATIVAGAAGTGTLTLAGTQAQINAALGTLGYQGAADFNGADTLLVRAQDASGASATRSVPIAVAAINDAPAPLSSAPAELGVDSAQFPVSLGLEALGYGPGGGADEVVQDLVVTIAVLPPAGAGVLVLADGITPVRAGHDYTVAQLQGLRFIAATGNTAQFDLSWTVRDDGGRADGGADSRVDTLRVNVNTVASEPVPPAPAPPPSVHPAVPPVAPPAPAPAPPPAERPAPPPSSPPGPGHTSRSLQEALGPGLDTPVVPLNTGTLSFAPPVAHLLAEADAGRILHTVVFDRGGLELISAEGQADLLLSRMGLSTGSDGPGLDDLQRSLRSTAFTGELDRLREAAREELDLDASMSISAVSVSFGLSLVYFLWLVRGGVLLGSYLSALPAWRLLDPLPVLSRVEEEDASDEEPLHDEGRRGRNTLRGFG